jgi:putative ABC transport system substrate-binding protein
MKMVGSQWTAVRCNPSGTSAPRISLVLSLVTALLTTPSIHAEAQQKRGVARIGYLSGGGVGPRTDAFREGLRELGYMEGKNIFIESRAAQGKIDRLPTLASELVRLKVEVLVTLGAADTRAAKNATDAIPIVMAQDPDPVGNGFVASLARPGGNITGLSSLRSDLNGKRLELLKEILPKLSRLTVLGSSTNPANAQQLRETELAAVPLRIQVQNVDVRNLDDIKRVFRDNGQTEAVFVLGGPFLYIYRAQLAEFAAKSRLPTTYPASEYVTIGGLMSYGVHLNDLSRRAATYVDKILKGARPADLPVEQPTKFELVINLKAAKQIGLTIPPNVLARADRVTR